jgi:signal transduction histidine kinase
MAISKANSQLQQGNTTGTQPKTGLRNEHKTQPAYMAEQLAVSIAHELKQPLTSIVADMSAGIRWLDRDEPDIDEAIASLREVSKTAQHCSRIINALLSLAKQNTSDHSVFIIANTLGNLLTQSMANFGQHGIQIKTCLDFGISVLGAETQLRLVLQNLIDNAVDAMLSNPSKLNQLYLETHRVGNEVVVLVEDSGPGISEEQRGKVFDAFFTTKEQGVGMGLAICAAVIAQHGGVIMSTQGRNGNNIFFFTLPLAHYQEKV